MRRENKKGAVELSLNLIIMLIIGLVVMGLIIAFVTSFLGEAQDEVGSALTPDDNAKIKQVIRELGDFATLSANTEIVRGSGKSGKVYIKVVNSYSNIFEFTGGQVPQDGTGSLYAEITAGRIESGQYSDGIEIYAPKITLTQGTSDGYVLDVYASDKVPLGTYYASFTVKELSDSDSIDNVIVTIDVK